MAQATRGTIVWSALFKSVVKILPVTKCNIAPAESKPPSSADWRPLSEKDHTRGPKPGPCPCLQQPQVQAPHRPPQQPELRPSSGKAEGKPAGLGHGRKKFCFQSQGPLSRWDPNPGEPSLASGPPCHRLGSGPLQSVKNEETTREAMWSSFLRP